MKGSVRRHLTTRPCPLSQGTSLSAIFTIFLWASEWRACHPLHRGATFRCDVRNLREYGEARGRLWPKMQCWRFVLLLCSHFSIESIVYLYGALSGFLPRQRTGNNPGNFKVAQTLVFHQEYKLMVLRFSFHRYLYKYKKWWGSTIRPEPPISKALSLPKDNPSTAVLAITHQLMAPKTTEIKPHH